MDDGFKGADLPPKKKKIFLNDRMKIRRRVGRPRARSPEPTDTGAPDGSADARSATIETLVQTSKAVSAALVYGSRVCEKTLVSKAWFRPGGFALARATLREAARLGFGHIDYDENERLGLVKLPWHQLSAVAREYAEQEGCGEQKWNKRLVKWGSRGDGSASEVRRSQIIQQQQRHEKQPLIKDNDDDDAQSTGISDPRDQDSLQHCELCCQSCIHHRSEDDEDHGDNYNNDDDDDYGDVDDDCPMWRYVIRTRLMVFRPHPLRIQRFANVRRNKIRRWQRELSMMLSKRFHKATKESRSNADRMQQCLSPVL